MSAVRGGGGQCVYVCVCVKKRKGNVFCVVVGDVDACQTGRARVGSIVDAADVVAQMSSRKNLRKASDDESSVSSGKRPLFGVCACACVRAWRVAGACTD